MNDVILSVPSLIGKPGDTVTVPIFIDNAPDKDVISDIVSLDLLLTYDPTLVSIDDPNPGTPENEAVRRAGISANWSIEGISNPVVNLEESGTIDIALIKDPTSPPNTESDTILEIDFTIAEEAEFGSRTLIDLQANDQESRIGIGDQDSPIDDESLEDGEIVVAELSIDDIEGNEGNEGNTEFNFTVSLSEALNQAVTVDYTIENDTATEGEDYTVAEDRFIGTLTFEPGDTEETVTVNVIGDTDFESDETFFVNLDNFTGGAIANPQGIGTITNDDLVRVSNDLEIPADPFLPDGDDISGSLSDSDSSYTFDGQNFLYDFYALPDDNSVNPDNTLTITLTSDEFRPLLMILDSEGEVIDFDRSSTQTTSSLNFTIPSNDPFFISVESFDADGIGNYQLDIDII